jgi:hypothetical protein
VAIETTPLGFQKPDGNELLRNGDNAIATNAQKAQDLIAAAQDADAVLGNRIDQAEGSVQDAQEQLAAAQAADAALAARIGITEAKIDAGAGGPGLSEDPDHPGLYYFAGPGFSADPDNAGLYTFQEATP